MHWLKHGVIQVTSNKATLLLTRQTALVIVLLKTTFRYSGRNWQVQLFVELWSLLLYSREMHSPANCMISIFSRGESQFFSDFFFFFFLILFITTQGRITTSISFKSFTQTIVTQSEGTQSLLVFFVKQTAAVSSISPCSWPSLHIFCTSSWEAVKHTYVWKHSLACSNVRFCDILSI